MDESALSEFLAGVRPDAAPIVAAIDDAIRRAAPLDSAVKWRQLTYAAGGDYHHWVCATAVTKRRVSLNFHFGSMLADPEAALRAGTSAFMRMLDFETLADVDAGLIGARVVDAVARLECFKANLRRVEAIR